MMSLARKPFKSYEYGNQMIALAEAYLSKYGPDTPELLGSVAHYFSYVDHWNSSNVFNVFVCLNELLKDSKHLSKGP